MKVVKAKSATLQGVRARARAREMQKMNIWSTQNGSWQYDSFFSKHLIKTSDVFQKNVGLFPKNVGSFSQNVGDKIMNVRLSLSALLDKLKFRWIKEVYIWRNYQNLVPLPM